MSFFQPFVTSSKYTFNQVIFSNFTDYIMFYCILGKWIFICKSQEIVSNVQTDKYVSSQNLHLYKIYCTDLSSSWQSLPLYLLQNKMQWHKIKELCNINCILNIKEHYLLLYLYHIPKLSFYLGYQQLYFFWDIWLQKTASFRNLFFDWFLECFSKIILLFN